MQLLVSVTKDLTDRVKAGQLVKELAPIVGGGGGGRPDFAEAGGKDPSKIDELLGRGARELRDGGACGSADRLQLDRSLIHAHQTADPDASFA